MANGPDRTDRHAGDAGHAWNILAGVSFEAKAAGAYFLIGLAWVQFEHSLLAGANNVLKDSLYILTSTLVFFWIARKGIRQIRNSEAALAENEERLTRILETAASGIFVLDGEGSVTFANRSAEGILGMPRKRIIGERFDSPGFGFLAPDGRPVPRDGHAFVRVLSDGGPVSDVEYVIERPDGARSALSVNAAPLRDRAGRLTGVVVSATDITERKRLADLNLRKLSLAVDQSPVAVATTDRNGQVEYVNPSFTAVTGYSAEDVRGSRDVCPTADAPEACEQIRRAIAEGGGWTGVFRNRRKDGTFYWESAVLSPIRDDEGRVFSFLWLRADITDRKRAEEELRESEERFRQMFEQNGEPVIVFRAGHAEILDANPAALTLYGLSLDELVGGGPELFVAPEERAAFLELVAGVADGKGINVDRASHVRKDGRRIIVSIRGKAMKLRGGTVSYCTFRDITERIRLEEEAKVRNAQLIHASRIASLGMLVSGVAHEVNNPNNLVMFNAPIVGDAWKDAIPLLDRYRDEEGDFVLGGLPYSEMRGALPRLLDGIGDASRRIRAIVENLKQFAAQDRSTSECALDVNESVRLAADILRPEIARRAIRFEADYGSPLPALRGCAQQLEQVVLNLLMNALQAVREPSRTVRIATRANAETGCVEICVQDEGVGMPEEVVRKLGEPFFTTRAEAGGLGLGLSISSSIVKAHGGTMTFRSSPGQGTVVVVSLPPARAPES